jgi:hypothetical protein
VSLELALAALRNANRVDGAKNSYRKDNPTEYAAVMAYLDGGPRPDPLSEMGIGLVLVEDERRGVTPPPPSPPTSPAFYTADFEAGNFSEVTSNQAPTRVVIGEPLHGSKGVRVTCGPSDANQLYDGSPPRAEMQIKNIRDFFGGNPEGRDTWITWYMKLLSGWDHGTSNSWAVLSQILGQTGTYFPAFSLYGVGPAPGTLYAIVRGGTPSPTDHWSGKPVVNPIPLDQLLKLKVHHRWSTGASGLVEVFLNNQLRATFAGPNNWVGFETTLYQKGGIYRSANGITRDSVMLYDYVRWFTSDPGDL